MRSGGAEGLPRGVRSDADIGRARIICPGFRLDWIMFGESGGAVGHEVVTPSFCVRQIPPHCAASLAGALQRTHAREEAFSKRQTQEHKKKTLLVRWTSPFLLSFPRVLETLRAVFI